MDAPAEKTLLTLSTCLSIKNVERELNNVLSENSDYTDTSSNKSQTDEQDDLSSNIEMQIIYAALMIGETRGRPSSLKKSITWNELFLITPKQSSKNIFECFLKLSK
ncbi:PREDICTED: uncharacterized protein LOC105450897 [Wasmannia auropunctata]|uniref:uncharacterized protein LOC105450897 n=1 Tax=Wasmannia auropunctata TaxID=64793 RepID=UPI0005EE5818|nr:PREDICTED: uncharacterized protein LOC105450897 [Wasmannia auropunctata]